MFRNEITCSGHDRYEVVPALSSSVWLSLSSLARMLRMPRTNARNLIANYRRRHIIVGNDFPLPVRP